VLFGFWPIARVFAEFSDFFAGLFAGGSSVFCGILVFFGFFGVICCNLCVFWRVLIRFWEFRVIWGWYNTVSLWFCLVCLGLV